MNQQSKYTSMRKTITSRIPYNKSYLFNLLKNRRRIKLNSSILQMTSYRTLTSLRMIVVTVNKFCTEYMKQATQRRQTLECYIVMRKLTSKQYASSWTRQSPLTTKSTSLKSGTHLKPSLMKHANGRLLQESRGISAEENMCLK